MSPNLKSDLSSIPRIPMQRTDLQTVSWYMHYMPPPHTNKCNLKYLRAGKIASQIKVFATKFEDLSSIPTTHMVERKNWLIQVILSPPLTSTCSHRHTLGKTDNMYMHRHSYKWQNTHTYMQTHTEKEDFKNEI